LTIKYELMGLTGEAKGLEIRKEGRKEGRKDRKIER
jgi:hypothetical protein